MACAKIWFLMNTDTNTPLVLSGAMARLSGYIVATLFFLSVTATLTFAISGKVFFVNATPRQLNDIWQTLCLLNLMSLFVLYGFCIHRRTSKRLSEAPAASDENAQYLQAVLDNILYSVIIIDAKGIIQSCNLGTQTIFHYSQEELVGRNVSILTPEPYRSHHDSYIAQYLTSGNPKIIGTVRELTAVDKHGHEFPIELGIAEMKHDKKRRFVGMIRNISDQKLTTETLKKHHDELKALVEEQTLSLQIEALRLKDLESLALEKQNFLDTVIEHIPLGIFVKNVKDNYRWVLWNRASERLFEMSASEVIGKVDYDLFPKEEADFFRATDINVMASGAVVVPSENVTTKRGTWVARTIKVPVYDELGEPYLMLGILEDITEANEKEARLKDYALKLEHQQNSLIDAKRTAEKANALKSEFLANMSHELRTPMHSIITFSRQGIERIHRWSPEEQKENLGLIRESGERLLRLINDLLDISKLESGKVDISFERHSLEIIIQKALAELQALINEKHLRLDVDFDPEVPAIECDSDKIVRMLLNVLSNAIKFSANHKCIYIRVNAQDTMVRMEIEDEGLGIPPDELEQVFDKFIQSSKTKTGAGGTGLGLAICREIVNLHAGTITAHNNERGGATFVVTLPYSQPKR